MRLHSFCAAAAPCLGARSRERGRHPRMGLRPIHRPCAPPRSAGSTLLYAEAGRQLARHNARSLSPAPASPTRARTHTDLAMAAAQLKPPRAPIDALVPAPPAGGAGRPDPSEPDRFGFFTLPFGQLVRQDHVLASRLKRVVKHMCVDAGIQLPAPGSDAERKFTFIRIRVNVNKPQELYVNVGSDVKRLVLSISLVDGQRDGKPLIRYRNKLAGEQYPTRHWVHDLEAKMVLLKLRDWALMARGMPPRLLNDPDQLVQALKQMLNI